MWLHVILTLRSSVHPKGGGAEYPKSPWSRNGRRGLAKYSRVFVDHRYSGGVRHLSAPLHVIPVTIELGQDRHRLPPCGLPAVTARIRGLFASPVRIVVCKHSQTVDSGQYWKLLD